MPFCVSPHPVVILACLVTLSASAQDRDILQFASPTGVYLETDYAGNDGRDGCDWYASGTDLIAAADAAREFGTACRVVIRLNGIINGEGAVRFADVARRLEELGHRPVRLVLDSRGGDSAAAFAIARTIRETATFREQPLETTVADHDTAVCFSACIIVFAAGYRRSAEFNLSGDPRLASRLGLHRPGQFDRDEQAYDSDATNRDIMYVDRALRRFFPTVGVSEEIVDAMFQVPFDEIHLVTEEEATAWGLTRTPQD